MTTTNYLDKYKLALLDYYHENLNESVSNNLYMLGREIHEELKPKAWTPSIKKYYFDCQHVFLNDKRPILEERSCNTKQQAELRLKQEQILNTINSCILEDNEKAGYKADWHNSEQVKCFIKYDYHQNEWYSNYTYQRKPFGCEVTNEESITKLVELLNAGLIKNVPAKLDD